MRLSELEIELTDADIDRIANRVADLVQPRLQRTDDAPKGDGSMMSVKEVCARLGIGRTTLWAMRKRGEIKPTKVGKSLRFRSEDVEKIRNS